ncbi:hypothetical protein OUZ56_006031 [Daphnia magna]|uniref:Uncharacterized protein n=1 Tax=Daphnia magna TaxID=35525 RepID=A0ABQ9YUJ7_9CRUS|nr:hypothetical protein OUZ56_006031 [Daphnia magna]
MFSYSDVVDNLRVLECALVRFVDSTFDNHRSCYSRLLPSDRVFFFTILAEVQRTGARLSFSPSVSTVWFADYYFSASLSSSTYSGYAKYRELFCMTHACLLWWIESDEDLFHPTPHRSDFYTEVTQAEMDSRLSARQTWNDVLESFNMETPSPNDFHLLREFSRSLTSLLDYIDDQLNE